MWFNAARHSCNLDMYLPYLLTYLLTYIFNKTLDLEIYQTNNAVLEIINCTVTHKIVQKTQQFSFSQAKVRKICSKFCPEIFFHLLLQIHEYYLGNGFKTTSPPTATDEFMKREFKDILNFL